MDKNIDLDDVVSDFKGLYTACRYENFSKNISLMTLSVFIFLNIRKQISYMFLIIICYTATDNEQIKIFFVRMSESPRPDYE